LRKKMSVIASNGADGNDEDLFLSERLWDKVRQKGFEKVDENTDSDEEDESDDSELGSDDDQLDSDAGDDSDGSLDDKLERIEAMAG